MGISRLALFSFSNCGCSRFRAVDSAEEAESWFKVIDEVIKKRVKDAISTVLVKNPMFKSSSMRASNKAASRSNIVAKPEIFTPPSTSGSLSGSITSSQSSDSLSSSLKSDGKSPDRGSGSQPSLEVGGGGGQAGETKLAGREDSATTTRHLRSVNNIWKNE